MSFSIASAAAAPSLFRHRIFPRLFPSFARSFSTPKVSLTLLKSLRESSGAPITDCKEALTQVPNASSLSESELLQSASDWLRKKGLASAAKKSGRSATEGAVGVVISSCGKSAALVEVNSETDFCAKNDRFQSFVRFVSLAALKFSSMKSGEFPVEQLISNQPEINQSLTDTLTALRENLKIRRTARLEISNNNNTNNGIIGYYVHSAIGENNLENFNGKLGKTGSIVTLEGNFDSDEKLLAGKEFANKLAMQVVAASPRYFSRNTIPMADEQRERGIALEQSKNTGKSGKILDNIIEGRMKKFYDEYCFLEQKWVLGGGIEEKSPPKVSAIVTAEGIKMGIKDMKVGGFVKFTVGEGLSTASGPSFADEVASKLKK